MGIEIYGYLLVNLLFREPKLTGIVYHYQENIYQI